MMLFRFQRRILTYLELSGRTQDSKSVIGSGLVIYSMPITKLFANICKYKLNVTEPQLMTDPNEATCA